MKRLEDKIAQIADANSDVNLVKYLKNRQHQVIDYLLDSINNIENIFGNKNSALLPNKTFQTKEAIKAWLVSYLSKLLLVKHHEINLRLPFEYYGITSLEVLRLTHALEVWLEIQLSPKLVYEYPTIEMLAQHLAKQVTFITQQSS